MLIRSAGLPLAVLAAVVIAGCGDSGSSSSSSDTTPADAPAQTSAAQTSAAAGGPTAGGKATAVDIKDYLYAPDEIEVAPGAKVTWTNEDSSPHTATVKGGFDTDSIAQGKSASVTLTKPGTYAYYCAFHPYMHGTIVVKG